jgi:predicted N-acetyltransferase YhbS
LIEISNPIIEIREYIEEDIPKIIKLNQEVFSSQEHFNIQRNEKWFKWKNLDSPFGKSLIVVAENENSEIVGSRLFWPWEFQSRMTKLKAYQPADTVVHPDFRGKGLFYKMTKKALELSKKENTDVIFNFPNKNSLPGYLNLGWSYVNKLEWFVKVKNPFYFFNKNKKAKNLKDLNNFNLTLQKIGRIKEKISYDEKLKTKKTEDFLKWRYLENPNYKYGLITVSEKRKTLNAIFSINEMGNYRELFIVDIIGNFNLINNLVKEINYVSNEFKVSIIYILKNYKFDKKSFYQRGYIKLKNKNLVTLPLNLCLENKVKDYKNWEIFGGLHDAL